MSWHVSVGEYTLDSDDLRVGEIETIEKECERAWSLLNPLQSMRVARAFLRIMYTRSGMSTQAANKAIAALELRELKRAFEWVPDTDAAPLEKELPNPGRGDPATSSSTEPDDSTGPPP